MATEDERVKTALYDLLDPMSPDYDDIATGYLAELAAKRIRASEKDADEQRASKNTAYDERNRLVAVLSKLWPAHLARHPEADASWERDWMTIVCIHSPVGQLTWHVHDDHRLLFAHLTMGENHWDGHSTEVKYARLAAMGVAPPTNAVDPQVQPHTEPSPRDEKSFQPPGPNY